MRFSKSVLHSKTTQAYEAYSDDYESSHKGYCFQLGRSNEEDQQMPWKLEVFKSSGESVYTQQFKLKREAVEFAQNYQG